MFGNFSFGAPAPAAAAAPQQQQFSLFGAPAAPAPQPGALSFGAPAPAPAAPVPFAWGQPAQQPPVAAPAPSMFSFGGQPGGSLFGGSATVTAAAGVASAPPPAPAPERITTSTPFSKLPQDLQEALQSVNKLLHEHRLTAAALNLRTGRDRALSELSQLVIALENELLVVRNALGALSRDVGSLRADAEDAHAASDDAVTRARIGTMGGAGSYELPLPNPFLVRFVVATIARVEALLRDVSAAEGALFALSNEDGGGAARPLHGSRPSPELLKAILVASSGALVRIAGGPAAQLHEAVAALRGMLLRTLNRNGSGDESEYSTVGWRATPLLGGEQRRAVDPFRDADLADAVAKRRAASNRVLLVPPAASSAPSAAVASAPPAAAAASLGGFGFGLGGAPAPAPFGVPAPAPAAPAPFSGLGFPSFGQPAPAPGGLFGAAPAPPQQQQQQPGVSFGAPVLKIDPNAGAAGGFGGFSTPVAGAGGFGAASGGRLGKSRRK